MVVQDVVSGVSNDIRMVLSPSGTDALLFLPWVDQVHKDALHTSIYNPLIQNMQTIATTANMASYALSVPVRRISLVYDRTFDRVLTPIDGEAFPTQKSDSESTIQAPESAAMLSATTAVQWPVFYRRISNTSLLLFPAPQKAAFTGTIEVYYEELIVSISALNSGLIIPDDGIDLMVAGVNMKACQFLKLPTEAQVWGSIYNSLKNGQAPS